MGNVGAGGRSWKFTWDDGTSSSSRDTEDYSVLGSKEGRNVLNMTGSFERSQWSQAPLFWGDWTPLGVSRLLSGLLMLEQKT